MEEEHTSHTSNEQNAEHQQIERDQTWWQGNKRLIMLIGSMMILILIAFSLAVHVFGWDWTGFKGYNQVTMAHTTSGSSAGTVVKTEVNQPGKTFWDWLSLLIAPAAVSLAGLWFTRIQQQRDKRLEQSQHDRDKRLADQQAQIDRYLALQNQQETALQSYFDRMSDLLLKENLRGSEPDAEVRNIARARTLTVLRGLDAGRKSSVLLFLMESHLIRLISLNQADLQGISAFNADFSGVNLSAANLSGAELVMCNMKGTDLTATNLSGAKLSLTNLSEAKLIGARLSNAAIKAATLSRADLQSADLTGVTLYDVEMNEANLAHANLSKAKLQETKLREAHIKHVKLSQADLQQIDLSGCDLSFLDLSGANLSQANLSQAKLSQANLSGANLSKTNLSQVNLLGANLSQAILKDAFGITSEELEQQVTLFGSAKGAIMPNGSIHS